MTPVEVANRVKRVGKMKPNKLDANLHRNAAVLILYHDLIQSIADGKCQSPANCCQLALKVEAKPEDPK